MLRAGTKIASIARKKNKMQKNNPKTPQKTKNKQTKFKTKTKNKTSRNHALARYVIFSAIQDCYSYLNSCPK